MASGSEVGEVAAPIEGALSGISSELSVRGEVVSIRVRPEDLREAAERLLRLGFDHVKAVTAIDRPGEGIIEVVYHASSYGNPGLTGIIAELRTSVPRDDPRVPTLTEIWPSALYQEREQWEMLGVIFEGHPELERLLLPEDFGGPPPLRKDFKIPTEGINA